MVKNTQEESRKEGTTKKSLTEIFVFNSARQETMQFAATHCAFTLQRYKKTQRLLYLGTTLSSVIDAGDLTWGAGLGLLFGVKGRKRAPLAARL